MIGLILGLILIILGIVALIKALALYVVVGVGFILIGACAAAYARGVRV